MAEVPARKSLTVASIFAVCEVLLYLLWSGIDDNTPFPSLEIQLGFVAGVSIFFMPHVLARLARHDRPSLYLAAGTLGILLTIGSTISPVLLIGTVPLVLIPSSVYLARYRRRPRPRAWTAAATPLLVAIGIAVVMALFLSSSDQRCYERANESGCSSDVIAVYESLGSLGLQVLLYRSAWAMAAPAVELTQQPLDVGS
ncbi:MAG: hypothetical protein ACRDKT_10560 [Actinomycetota bacterium]